MKVSLALALLCMLVPLAAGAQTQVDESNCRPPAGDQHRRQSVLIVDGGIVVPDGPEGLRKRTGRGGISCHCSSTPKTR